MHLIVTPIVVGGGRRSLPKNVRLKLELLYERRLEGGAVYPLYLTREVTRLPRPTVQLGDQ